ncbi:hypothetical protein N9H60_00885 [Flavimaricola sp.]|nr:hypothetical protein [Flavimaricola sp.]MDA9019723.1 hypothetical protein [Flavimaricola sp.]
MSDPVTNIEIEDVLSSIRRLVSEGDKFRPGGSVSHDPAERTNEAPETALEEEHASLRPRFVLTPALRVDSAPLVLEGAQASSGDTALDASTSDGVAQDAAAPVPEEGVEEDTTSPGRSRLEATIAELEAAIIGATDDWEPDGSEETPVVDWSTERAEGLFTSARIHPAEGEAEIVVLTPGGANPVEVASDRPTSRFSLEPEVSAAPVKEVIAPELSRKEADDDMADDLLRSEDGAYDPDLDEDLAAYLERDKILDEETLRNLVIEIVRQELQGTFGERITRNVRKLVRREIYRILASQDFD